MSIADLLDYIVNELPSDFNFDYDDNDHGLAYLTDTESGSRYKLHVTLDDGK